MVHESSTGASPIVKGLINNLREILPADEQAKLDAYGERAEATTPKGDFHRARLCVHWAIEVAERPEHSHLSHAAIRLKEIHKEYKDVWLGTEFGFEAKIGHGQVSEEIKGDQKVGPGEDIELLWVQEATDVAKGAAEKSGWQNVPWEALVDEVLKVG